MPILTVFADAVGILGGYLVSVNLLGSNPTIYIRRTFDYLDLEDIYIGLLKATVFGMIIATIGCYQGFNTQGGAEGVGKSTTRAVVMSSLLILIANYFITAMFF
jgi:phospholipid/cholesterol/gamma-HCH transport system permease protein